jgi:hypothetical protein
MTKRRDRKRANKEKWQKAEDGKAESQAAVGEYLTYQASKTRALIEELSTAAENWLS